MSVGDRSERLIELVRQHELYFTAQAQERPSENMRIFLDDYWTPFYDHFVGLSEPDVSIRFLGLSNELSRLRAIAAYNGIQTPDLGTAQHGYTQTSVGWGPGWSDGQLSRSDERLVDGIGYGLAKLLNTPIGQLADEADAYRRHQGATTMYGPTPAFVGRCYVGAPPAKYSLVNTVPVLAPGAGGMSVKLSLDGTRLTANVCIDGKCYRGEADLSGLVGYLGDVADAGLSHWHQRQHRLSDLAVMPRGARFQSDGKVLPPAAKVAGDALVGAIAERHANEFCAGWWHSLTHDIESGVKGIEHGLGGILKQLKGPIIAAATALAASVGIPPSIVQGLTSTLLDAASGVGQVKAAAKAALAKAEANPQLAQALAVAKKAVAQSTVAAQAAQTVADAAAGSPAAQQQIAQLAQAATGGDPAAQQAMSLVSQLPGMQQQIASLQQLLTQSQIQQSQQTPADAVTALQAQQSQIQQPQQTPADAVTALQAQQSQIQQPQQYAGDGSDGGGDGGDTSTSGVETSLRARAVALAQGSPAQVVGVVETVDGQWSAAAFATSDEADDWYGGWLGIPHAFLYVAYFDKSASWPYPENEQVARGAAARSAGTAVGVGPWMPILFTPIEAGLTALLAGVAGYMYGNDPENEQVARGAAARSAEGRWPAAAARETNEQVARGAAARSAGTAVGVGPWMPILFTPIEAGLTALLAGGAGYMYGKDHTRSAGWPALALAAGGGFAAGHWGERAVDWARGKWDAHEIAKAAKGAG
jgi:hypothetical protein